MALSDEQIVLTAQQIGGLFDDLAVHYQSDDTVRFARAIEAEVRKDDEALIRQMESALSWSSPHADAAHGWKSENWARKRSEAITAARARLLDSDLSNLTERGAKAWAGVDAQGLREGRWYMVTHDGVATLCEDRRDAEKEAKDADMAWPHSGPHRAVQLVEAGRASLSANAGEPTEADEWKVRGYLAKTLKCWHRLTGEEAAELVAMTLRLSGLYPTPQPAPPTPQAEGWTAEQALRKVLAAVQRYMPPDGPDAKDTLSEIIAIVDPWPLGHLEK